MELHLQRHHWERRSPDWAAAAVAGFAAGALLRVIEMVWSALVQGVSPWSLPRMIAAIALGPDTLQTDEFSVPVLAVALVIHYVLGIVFGMLLALIIAPFRLDSSVAMALLVGAVFGIALYLVDFYGMVRIFTWFKEVRGAGMLVLHIIFGAATAALYWKLERRSPETA